MTRGNTGTGEDGQYGEKESADHQQSVNERSLLILKILSQTSARYPEGADVVDIVRKLHAEDDKSWDWLCDLGLIKGEPKHAQLTVSGKNVVERAGRNADVRGLLDAAVQTTVAADKHASAVLAILFANYEQRYAGER